jgi:sortase A
VLSVACASFSALIVFFGLFVSVFSGIQEHRSQQQLYAQFRGLLDPASPVAPKIGGAIASGTPIALLSSDVANLHDTVVVEGTSSGDLFSGPGHLRNSPLPGQIGQSIVIGKAFSAGAPFGSIDRLRKGDVIRVITGQHAFRFVVLDHRVAGDELPHLPRSGSLLTLVSARANSWWSALESSHLYYVDTALVGRPVPTPVGRPTTITRAELQGQGDPAAWPWAVLGLVALLFSAVATAWLWVRWGTARVWLISGPVLLLVCWLASGEFLRLLANVY